MTYGHRAGSSPRQLLRDAAVTLAAVLLAFAALDDITTDRATTFTVESWLGFISVVALVAAAGAGSTIRPGTGPFQIEYLTTIAGLLWFLGLVGILVGQAWRRSERHAA